MNFATTLAPLDLLHFALAFFVILWGLALILPRRQPVSLRLAGLLLGILGINMFFLSFYSSGMYLQFPHFLGTQPPASYLLGPAIYFFARSVAEAWRPTRIHLLHFIPVLIIIAAYGNVYILSAETKYQIMTAWTWEAEDFGWRYNLNRAGTITTGIYHFMGLYLLFRSGLQSRIGFLVLLTVIPTAAFVGYGTWYARLWAQEIGVIFLEIHLLAFYLLFSRERTWMDRLAPEHRPAPANSPGSASESRAVPQSRLGNVNTPAVLDRLERLMVNEKCFVDEDLDIRRLAEMLDIKQHQLSELLNHVVGVDFKTYLNQFRVQEARNLLLAERDRSVLSIAFAVGFNSKSSFHLVFRKLTGITPTEFRQQHSVVA